MLRAMPAARGHLAPSRPRDLARAATRMALASVTLAAIALASRSVRGEERPRSLSLDYSVVGEGCPTKAEFLALVASHVGADPFTSGPGHVLSVKSERVGKALEIHLALPMGPDVEVPKRVFAGAENECAELVQRAAFTIALAIDDDAPRPVSPQVPPPKATVVPVPAAISAPNATDPDGARRPAEPAPASVLVGVGVGFHAGGAAVHPGVGLDVAGSYRLGIVSIGVVARAVLPTERNLGAGNVSTTTLGAGPLVCLAARRLGLCVPVTIGAVLGSGSRVSAARSDASPFITIGLRPELRIVQSTTFDAGLFAEGYVAPARTGFVFRDGTAFTTVPVGALVGIQGHIGLP